MPWAFRYVPFANLYDLSLAFAFGAGITTLLIMRREHFRLIAALSLPLAGLILVLAALVAWLTYAGFLHSRIAYGWKGRHSAYFAIVAFLFVIFTYLGVSYLLPGLHSYA